MSWTGLRERQPGERDSDWEEESDCSWVDDYMFGYPSVTIYVKWVNPPSTCSRPYRCLTFGFCQGEWPFWGDG